MEDIDSEMEVNEAQVFVQMTRDKTVSAVFLERTLVAEPTSILDISTGAQTVVSAIDGPTVYCSSSDTRDNNCISFTYTNNDGVDQSVLFKISFYADSQKEIGIYAAETILDTKRWYLASSIVSPFESNSVEVNNLESVNVFYVPEVLSQINYNHQRDMSINESNNSEKVLLCGERYYVDIHVMTNPEYDYKIIYTRELLIPCEYVENNLDRDKTDLKNWLCSGNGQMDLLVSESSDQSLFPSISSNVYGHFLISWQSSRVEEASVMGGIWDSINDILYSSGQGMWDKLYLHQGWSPKVLVDQSNNFYISGNTINDIYAYKCSLPSIPTVTAISGKRDIVYPEELERYDTSIIIRIYEEDFDRSLVLNKDKTVPVIEKRNISVEMTVPAGTYAARVRDADSSSWGPWISLDSNLLGLTEGNKRGYFISRQRAIVPWQLPRLSGFRRLCGQALTYYGVSNVACVDTFVNLEQLDYIVKFYTDIERSHELPIYKGKYIVSQTKDDNHVPLNNPTIIYLTVTFNRVVDYDYINCNIAQQGLSDYYNVVLTKSQTDSLSYIGALNVYSDDKMFNKDGLAFVDIIFPEEIPTAFVSNVMDKYNIILNNVDRERYHDLDPIVVFDEQTKEEIHKIVGIQDLQESYNKDDERFLFGNPDIFKNK